jgi:lactate dehydrogenase-like 2-hydroxyacid dehydrogenase
MIHQPFRTPMLVVCQLPDEVLRNFHSEFDVTLLPIEGVPLREELYSAAQGKEVILTSVNARFSADIIISLPDSVKAIATYSVGLDHLDIQAARSREIAVFNTPNVLTQSVADAALFLLLGAARRGTESISLIRGQGWSGWTAKQLNGRELANKALGILGMGGIGQAIAERARAFGMIIHYHNRTPLAADRERGATFHARAEDMLAQIDVLVLAAPSTAATRGFLNTTRLRGLRRDSIVVNIARGDLVDDEALIAALTSGHVFAAGLDVFNNEPRLDSRYFSLPNVFMLPHIGSSTLEARQRMGAVLLQGLIDWRAGRAATNRVV